MKKIIISMAAMAAFTLSSCNKEQLIEQEGNAATITAYTESRTKTALSGNDTDGYDVVWSSGDQIRVGSGYSGNLYRIYQGVGKKSAIFSLEGGSILKDGEYDSFYRMVEKSLPSNQKYYPDKDIRYSPMHARVTISNGKAGPAQFHNLCGLLRLTLKEKTGLQNDIKVSKITISSDSAMSGGFNIVDYAAVMIDSLSENCIVLDCANNEDNVTLSADGVDFYIALPAGTYTNVVVEVTDNDGSVCTKKLTNKSLTIERSKITPAIFTVENFVPCNIEAIDLGLSVLWANMNVGAVSPIGEGDYFAWGETFTKDMFDYKEDYYFDKGYTQYFSNGDNTVNLKLKDDVASVKWGGDWRMPTADEFKELLNPEYTTWEWIDVYPVTINGIKCTNGMKITSKINNNVIFLKGTVYYNSEGPQYPEDDCRYWSNTLSKDNSNSAFSIVCNRYLDAGGYHLYQNVTTSYRINGYAVRPVCPKKSDN